MMKGEGHLKQGINEYCNNAKICKMTTTPPPSFAKNVDENEQHKEFILNLIM